MDEVSYRRTSICARRTRERLLPGSFATPTFSCRATGPLPSLRSASARRMWSGWGPGTGRKSENIKRIRAIWQEDDHGHGGPFPPRSVIDTRSKGTGGKSRPVVGDRRGGGGFASDRYPPHPAAA